MRSLTEEFETISPTRHSLSTTIDFDLYGHIEVETYGGIIDTLYDIQDSRMSLIWEDYLLDNHKTIY